LNLGLFIPELSLAVFAVVVILLDLFIQRKGVLAGISIAGVVVSGGFTLAMWGGSSQAIFNNMLAVDNFALFFKLLFLGIAALVILASMDYVSKFTRFQGEYYALVLLSALGMMLMAATTELISIYIALELTSISLYILVGFLKDRKSTEASLKYLLLGAVASAVLLFGMALIFGFTGKTQLGEIAQVIQTMSPQTVLASPALILGMVLLVAGFSAFGLPSWLSLDWGIVFAVLSAISMTLGNIVAIAQTNIKRMLGYSSVAQAGYLMVGLATVGLSPAADVLGRSGVLFFLASYALTNLGAFIAIIAISNKLNSDLIDDYSGMGKRAPLVALALTLCLISLIGMPPAAGFMAKFYIFSSAVQHNLLWLVIIAVLNSVISAYYYLRVVKVMWLGEPASDERVPSSGALRLALALSCRGVLLLGIVPGYAMKLAEFAAKMFAF